MQNHQPAEPPEVQLSRRGGTEATKQRPPGPGGRGGDRNGAPHLHVAAENREGHLCRGRSPGRSEDPSPTRHWAREEEPPHHLAVRNGGDPTLLVGRRVWDSHSRALLCGSGTGTVTEGASDERGRLRCVALGFRLEDSHHASSVGPSAHEAGRWAPPSCVVPVPQRTSYPSPPRLTCKRIQRGSQEEERRNTSQMKRKFQKKN